MTPQTFPNKGRHSDLMTPAPMTEPSPSDVIFPGKTMVSESRPKKLWSPSQEAIEKSHMTRFRSLVNSRLKLSLETYEELWDWSIDDIESFWQLVWDYCQIKSSAGAKCVLEPSGATPDQVPLWFPGAALNFTENILERSVNCGRADSIALLFANELDCKASRQVSFGELKEQVGRMSNALRSHGIAKGDVVAMYAPNLPECVIFTLAAASIGAIVTAVSPDFGPQAVLDRFQQTAPKLMLTANAAIYNGKVHGHWEKVRAVLDGCKSIKKIVWVKYVPSEPVCPIEEVQCEEFSEFIKGKSSTLLYEQLSFAHPLYIMYSSGTTGKPKCLVHSAGGTLLQHMKEHLLHADLGPEDRLLQYTTVGWMMWQWQLTALGTGCSLVLYDGSPFKPDESHLLRVISENRVTAFGTSAKYLQRLEEVHISPKALGIDVSQLRIVFSTGSPLPASIFDYITDQLGPLMIASITGGTDIISLFAGGNPVLPVYSGLIQSRCLGMAIFAFNEEGKRVYDEPGDLVCTRPFPSQPVFFWGDSPDRPAYKNAYFSSQWPTVWHHGDFIQIDRKTGGILMLGRSDGTLNPSGVRFGSADLYAVLGSPEFRGRIVDSLAVGVRRPEDPDERVILFLHLPNDSMVVPEELAQEIKLAIRTKLSPRHIPSLILPTPQIPYTLNGKKVEVAVKRILCGMNEPATTGSLSNPDSLDYFRSLQI